MSERDVIPHAREQRVRQCMDLMAAGKWVRGETVKALAIEWDISYDMARQISAEASRRDAARVTDRDIVKGEACASLRDAVLGASEDRDWGGVARAADVWTRIVGAREPEQHVVASVDVTDPERRAALRRAVLATEGKDDE